jgi:hypothetical protein
MNGATTRAGRPRLLREDRTAAVFAGSERCRVAWFPIPSCATGIRYTRRFHVCRQSLGVHRSSDRRRRFGRIRFTPTNVTGTAISGRTEIFRIRYNEGFCKFEFTGTCTMAIPTMIFKSLTQDWPVIIDFRASRDVSNVVELPTLTSWEPEQDLSHDTREIAFPPRIVDER